MKKLNIILLIIIVLITIIKFTPLKPTKYKIPNSEIILDIPALSIFKEECCMYSSSFKTFRSKYIVQKELDKIINNYEKKTCNNKIIYYNKEQDITITEYGIYKKFLFNTFYITYTNGEINVNKCSVVTDPTRLIYSIKKSNRPDDDCYGPMKYKNENGNIYNLYYDFCFGSLLIETGTGTMQYLWDMLVTSYISMQDVIIFLEYQTENNKATKAVYKDGGSILYKNKDFALLKCNTLEGNQDIYIGNINMNYEKDYCK